MDLPPRIVTIPFDRTFPEDGLDCRGKRLARYVSRAASSSVVSRGLCWRPVQIDASPKFPKDADERIGVFSQRVARKGSRSYPFCVTPAFSVSLVHRHDAAFSSGSRLNMSAQ
jgi:hypothetical protein